MNKPLSVNKPLSEEEILDILEHSNRKGSHWYQHQFGKWQKQARYANGQSDPNAKPLEAKDIHAPGTARNKKERAERNAQIKEASKSMSTEELKQVTERIKAEKEFLELALTKDYNPSRIDKIKAQIPKVLKVGSSILVANKQMLSDKLSDIWLDRELKDQGGLERLAQNPQNVPMLKQLKAERAATVLAVFSVMEALSKAKTSNQQGGGKK